MSSDFTVSKPPSDEPGAIATVGDLKVTVANLSSYFSDHAKVLKPELANALQALWSFKPNPELTQQLAAIAQSVSSIQKSLSAAVSAKALLAPTNFLFPANWDAELKQALAAFQPRTISLFTIDWDAIQARDEMATRFAAKRNWFLQPETEMIFLVKVMEHRDNPAKFDGYFAGVIKRDLEEIRTRLMTDFPKRAAIIAEAFALHTEQRYLASIPLMLTTAEGIAWDATATSVFNSKGGRPGIALWLEESGPDGYKKALIAGLSTEHPLSIPQSGHLNRHHVLHGRDTTYGNELFGLQAASILGCIGWVFAPNGLLAEKMA